MADSFLHGGCFCNSVRYEIRGSLQNARACHCSRCRKAFSGASSAYAELSPSSSLEWLTGEDLLSIHDTGGGWGMGFCSKCGSTLCGIHNGEVHGLTLGCIDGDPGSRSRCTYSLTRRRRGTISAVRRHSLTNMHGPMMMTDRFVLNTSFQ